VTAVLSATAVLALLFGIGQLLIPGLLLSTFGVSLDVNADLFARALGGAYLGYAVFNWQVRGSDVRAQRAAVLADLVVALSGVIISLYAISLGNGNALMWIWVAVFLVFGAWQAYVLSRRTPG
jgi:hypothetical protein